MQYWISNNLLILAFDGSNGYIAEFSLSDL